MILETEERELLQRQIDRITYVDEAPDKNTPLPTEERELMEDFRNKLVQEMEEFNQNVDKTLKVAGELGDAWGSTCCTSVLGRSAHAHAVMQAAVRSSAPGNRERPTTTA